MRQNARITIVGKPIKKMFYNEKENSAIVKKKNPLKIKYFCVEVVNIWKMPWDGPNVDLLIDCQA